MASPDLRGGGRCWRKANAVKYVPLASPPARLEFDAPCTVSKREAGAPSGPIGGPVLALRGGVAGMAWILGKETPETGKFPGRGGALSQSPVRQRLAGSGILQDATAL